MHTLFYLVSIPFLIPISKLLPLFSLSTLKVSAACVTFLSIHPISSSNSQNLLAHVHYFVIEPVFSPKYMVLTV